MSNYPHFNDEVLTALLLLFEDAIQQIIRGERPADEEADLRQQVKDLNAEIQQRKMKE